MACCVPLGISCLVSHADNVSSVWPCVQSTVLARRTLSHPRAVVEGMSTCFIVPYDTFDEPSSIMTVSLQTDQEGGSILSSDEGIQWQKYSRTNISGLQK